jgi:hypothetical protein
MESHTIRNTFFGLLIFALLAGTAQEAMAQRPAKRGERHIDKKRSEQTAVRTDRIKKPADRQTVRNDRSSKPARSTANYAKPKNRKQDYREYNRKRKSYIPDRGHTYKDRYNKRHHPSKKTWHRNDYRKPMWSDYRRPGFYYPRIGMRVSLLPRGYFSFRIGNLRFYSYRGVYYRYNPALRVYVVVNKPHIETRYTYANWDRITLMDGSTIEGVYLYTENDIVMFEVGDALLEIPVSEIRILAFSDR